MPDYPLDPEPPASLYEGLRDKAEAFASKAQQPSRLPVWWGAAGWLLAAVLMVLVVLRG